jgi:hypothetical protein
VAPSYIACIRHRRPIYSVAMVQDADGKDVSYERLLLPFGFGERVEHVISLLKAISVEGGFKVTNLMGLHSLHVPVRIIDAVIDREIAAAPASGRAADDVVETGQVF